jgi:hypothetical protein
MILKVFSFLDWGMGNGEWGMGNGKEAEREMREK